MTDEEKLEIISQFVFAYRDIYQIMKPFMQDIWDILDNRDVDPALFKSAFKIDIGKDIYNIRSIDNYIFDLLKILEGKAEKAAREMGENFDVSIQ